MERMLELAHATVAAEDEPKDTLPLLESQCEESGSHRAYERQLADERQKKSAMRRVIASYGPKHHCKLPLSALKPIGLSQCSVPNVHRGRVLICQVMRSIQEARSFYPMRTLVRGNCMTSRRSFWTIPLSVHYAEYMLLLEHGTVIAVKEPNVRYGPVLRVDSPLDIELIYDPKSIPRQWHTNASVADLKQAANLAFGNSNAAMAIHLSNQALAIATASTELALLRLNRTAYYLHLGRPQAAAVEVKLLLDSMSLLSTLTPEQKEKAYRRAAQAAVNSHNWNGLADLLSQLPQDFIDLPSFVDAKFTLQEARLQEQGIFDWPSLYNQLAESKKVQLADWQSSAMEIRSISGRGRGIVATRAIKAGELLLVEAPIASSSEADRKPQVCALDLACESVSSVGQSILPGLVMRKCMDDIVSSQRVQNLFAGPHFPSPPSCEPNLIEASMGAALDSGFIECVITYNAFKPESITQTPVSVSPGSPQTALYYVPSFINHDCIGNSIYTFLGEHYVLRSSKAIAAGTEITSSYTDATMSVSERARKLRHHFKRCECALCTLDRMDSDTQHDKRSGLWANAFEPIAALLESGKKVDPHRIEHCIKAMLKTYDGSPRTHRVDLYYCYRLLVRAIEQADLLAPDKSIRLLHAEAKALEALGFCISEDALPNLSIRADAIPVYNQNAILSILNGARALRDLKSPKASEWLNIAQYVHDIVFGAGLFLKRLGTFVYSPTIESASG